MKLKIDRATRILAAGMTALVIFSAILIYIRTEENRALHGRNQALRDNLDAAEGKISALEALIGSAPTPHPALPGAGDLDNWGGGLWKEVTDNVFALVSKEEVSFNAPWLDEVEKASAVHFHREANGWESLHFTAVEFSSAVPAENAFAYVKEQAENAEGENLYVVSSDEDLIRFNMTRSDVTVFRKGKALFVTDLAGDNVGRWASAPYAELLKGRIEKGT